MATVVWTIEQIADIVGGRVHRPYLRCSIEGYSVDSRSLKAGELFVALRGEHTDGHLFLSEAFRRGASGALVERLPTSWEREFRNCIEVPDTLEALQKLAAAHRLTFDIPLVGITGSSGKTTTKELLYALLKLELMAYRSPGNYNTEIGLPLALLSMPQGTEVGVFELALQRPGDIRTLSEIARPTIGVITTIGDAHLGFFKDREELARAKWELVSAIPQGNLAVLNCDSPYVAQWADELCGVRVIGFGIEDERAQVRAEALSDERLEGIAFTLCTPKERFRVETRLLGRANVYNVLAATAVALELGVAPETIQRALKEYVPVARRMELKRSRRFGLILDDSYNANPTSTGEALRTLMRLHVPYRKIFVFGDMLELGESAAELHRQLADVIDGAGIERVFTVGELARETVQALLKRAGWGPKRAMSTLTLDELEELLATELCDDRNLILMKGSRAMGLDRLVDRLTEQ